MPGNDSYSVREKEKYINPTDCTYSYSAAQVPPGSLCDFLKFEQAVLVLGWGEDINLQGNT